MWRTNAATRAVLACGLLLLDTVSAATIEPRPARFIEMTGEARLDVPSDVALIDFGVVTQAETAAVAGRENSARMEQVMAALRKVIDGDAQIGTGAYSIRPLYASTREGGAPRVTGYVVSNVVHVKTSALTRLGELIDTAVRAGANQVQRLIFTLKDDSAPRRAALRSATLQALEKTKIVAEALGVAPGPVRSLVEHDLGPIRPLVRQAAAIQAESAFSTPVEPGFVEVRARVVLTVEIADTGARP